MTTMKRLIIAAFFISGAALPASAQWTAHMVTYGSWESPPSFVRFCVRHPDQCARRAAARHIRTTPEGKVILTPELREQLNGVNNHVNATITQVSDWDLYGVEEHWALPKDGKGDCEDIALLKRKRLLEAGWPSSALVMTVVRDWTGDGHAVLTVRTNDGDLVLDNRTNAIRNWLQSGYTFYIRQSQSNPRRWVLITHGMPAATASMR